MKKKPTGERLSERGFEKVGRKMVPYQRDVFPGNLIVTSYGSQDASDHCKGITLLVKHERRGARSWGTVASGEVTQVGPATNKLQGINKTRAGNNLFYAVQAVRRTPSAIHEVGYDDFSPGKIIRDAIAEAITSGDKTNLALLGRCIDASILREVNNTNAEILIDAMREEANRRGRIPLRKELHLAYDRKMGGSPNAKRTYSDPGNFSKLLNASGLGWVPM